MPLRTLPAPARQRLRVLGSRFIACAAPIADEAQARGLLEALRREFPDATHHCWALRLRTRQGDRDLHDDAGEPAGTAGPPILQALRRSGITNAMVVVVRYYGGKKLGRGGLARVYREAARASLESAGAVEVVLRSRLRLFGPVTGEGEVRRLLARHEGRVVQASYGESQAAVLIVEVPEDAAGALRTALPGATRGSWTAADDG